MFKVTYRQEQGPPAMGLEQYTASVQSQYSDLIENCASEKAVQLFLERNPCLVPGAWTPGFRSGHFPLHCALITQPRLPGLRSRQPDFMWISTHSGSWFPTLIEIESPRKRIFTKARVPTAAFTEARNQLAQWRVWFNSPANVQQFIDSYGIPGDYVHYRTRVLHTILIYGRRQEFAENPDLSMQRGELVPGSNEELMSYDRLAVDASLKQAITLHALGSGRYRVIAIPPVFSLSPIHSERLLCVEGFS